MINQLRPTQRRTLKTLNDEESLTTDIINLQKGSAGTDTAGSLHCSGIVGGKVNHKRVERIWRRKGLNYRRLQVLTTLNY